MRVVFLGTGTSQGVPMIGCECEVCCSDDRRDKRLRSSVYVETSTVNIVIDTSPDFRYQMLRAGVKKIDGVLYTHDHKDHTGGMDDLRAYNYFMRKPIDVYCTAHVGAILRKDFDYAFADFRYPGVPEIDMHIIDEQPFMVGTQRVIPIRGKHFKQTVFGYRISDFCYLTDMNSIEDSEIEKFRGVDVLVINALRHKEHMSHFTLEQALEVIAKAAPRRAFLTHISHQLGKYTDISPTLPSNVELAYDGLELNF